MFARRSAAEIVARDHHVARLDALDEGRVDVFHRVPGQFGLFVDVQVTRRNNFVSVDARVRKRANPFKLVGSSGMNFLSESLGRFGGGRFSKLARVPVVLVMAVAAAVAGLAR